jgi:predicted HicB family RNase H-like nuclease
MKKTTAILKQATDAARLTQTWADLSNALFDPFEGLVTRAYATRAEREAFRQTEEYRKIRELLSEKIKATGLVAGAMPRKSGRFVVRLPQSLHAALEQEAAREGVSLNQLVVAKLAFRLGSLAEERGVRARISSSNRMRKEAPSRDRKKTRAGGQSA